MRDYRGAFSRRAKRVLRPIGSVHHVRTPQQIVLTYDDGPDPDGTAGVLAALADAGVTATFFVLLTRVRRYPALMDELVAAGHEVALHGVDHKPLPAFSPSEVRRRCIDGRAELEDRVGRPVSWMRPPYGRLRVADALAVRASGLTPVLWGPSTGDTIDGTLNERVARACDGARAGAILLSHDGFASLEDGVDDGPRPILDRGALAAAVIERYRSLGLLACSLGEAAATGSPRRRAVFIG